MRRFLGVMAMALTAAVAMGERVTLTVEQPTEFGQSIFVTAAEWPFLGSGAMDRAAKMLPTDYPVWSLNVDLPAGVSISPVFYVRIDSPAQVANSTNGTLVTMAPVITAPPAPDARPQSVHVFAQSSDLTVQIGDYGPLHQKGAPAEPGWQTASVESDHVVHARTVRVVAGAEQFPPAAQAPVRLTGRETWWRHGQAFHYEPGDTPPSAPREESFLFVPTGFPGRTVRVVLPRGYDANATRRYPVIYALDGQNLLSTYTGPRFGSWDLDVSLRSLIARGEIPECILIGIDNTNIRHVEYTPEWGSVFGDQGRGNEFLRMLRDELVPEVEGRYRAIPGAGHRVYLGSSLGALSGYEAAHEFASTWGTVVAMSPSTQVNTDQWLAYAQRPAAGRARLWLDSGTGGTSADGYANTMRVRDALLTTGGEGLGAKFFHFVGLNQQHNEAAWKGRAPEALRWAFQTWTPPRAEGWVMVGVGR